MTQIKYLFLSLALLACGWNAVAQTTDEDAALKQKINAAVMNVYDQQLEKEPGDYATRFARSYQYFYNGQIDEALADITKLSPTAQSRIVKCSTMRFCFVPRFTTRKMN